MQELDLEGDWDPDAHDKQMSKIYGADDDGVDEEKPTWDDDLDIADIVPEEAESSSKKKKKKKKKADEDQYEDGVDVDDIDADVEKQIGDEEWDGTEETRKQKLDQYMDELYELEFNDVVSSQHSAICGRILIVYTIGRRHANTLQVHQSPTPNLRS